MTDQNEMFEATEKVASEMKDRGWVDHFVNRLEARKGGLRPSKPQAQDDDGLEIWIWRYARYHCGDDQSQPITADMDLQLTLEDLGIDASVNGILDEEGKQIRKLLDRMVTEVALELGRNPAATAVHFAETGVFDKPRASERE